MFIYPVQQAAIILLPLPKSSTSYTHFAHLANISWLLLPSNHIINASRWLSAQSLNQSLRRDEEHARALAAVLQRVPAIFNTASSWRVSHPPPLSP